MPWTRLLAAFGCQVAFGRIARESGWVARVRMLMGHVARACSGCECMYVCSALSQTVNLSNREVHVSDGAQALVLVLFVISDRDQCSAWVQYAFKDELCKATVTRELTAESISAES